MSKSGQHLVVVAIRGLQRERHLVDELTLEFNGSAPIQLKPDAERHELSLSVGVYHLILRFQVSGKQYSRSLSALRVPPASTARFDLDQAIADRSAAEREQQDSKWQIPAEAAE